MSWTNSIISFITCVISAFIFFSIIISSGLAKNLTKNRKITILTWLAALTIWLLGVALVKYLNFNTVYSNIINDILLGLFIGVVSATPLFTKNRK